MEYNNLRYYQQEAYDSTINEWDKGNDIVFIQSSTGSGKCLGVDTKILMYDGSIKMSQDIVRGDILMGPDSKPRNVLSTCSGTDELYKITPVKGDSYVVNSRHILSLMSTPKSKGKPKEIVNISVQDYLKSNSTFKHCHKGWRTAVDFDSNVKLDLSPYMLGLWLGDGTTAGAAITNTDNEVMSYIENWCKENDCYTRYYYYNRSCPVININGNKISGCKGGSNTFLNLLRSNGVLNNKHIPHHYKTASRSERLELLAGIIDTDGYMQSSGFDLVLKVKALMEDVVFVARSLGFSCYMKECTKGIKSSGFTGTYYRININGDVNLIPTKVARRQAPPRKQIKSVLVTGISVEPIGIGEYYGFQIDGDNLFMLGDFTVTHNSVIFTCIANTLRKTGASILFLCNRKELIEQAHGHFTRAGIPAGIIMDGYELRFDLRCQVGSIQTIIRKSILPHFDYIIVDEAHFVTRDNSYGTVLNRFPNARMLMVSATPWRMNGEGFENIIDGKTTQLIQTRTMKELINDGWLVPFKYLVPHVPDLSGISLHGGDYDPEEAEEAMKLVPIVDSYLDNTKDMQGIVFGINVHHSNYIVKQYDQAGIRCVHIDANTNKYDRVKAFKDFRSGDLKLISNVGIISYGVDIPQLQFVQLAAPTKSLANYGQRVGRVTRPLTGLVNNSMTAVERCMAIANSSKPKGIILDNAGCFIDNGFPDDDHNWPMYFKGWKQKRDATVSDEFIEMLMFELEDPLTGGRIRTNKAEECAGMILIEVTKELQDNYKSVKHLKEFDKLYLEACIKISVKKPGYYAFYRFMTYLSDRNMICEDVCWRYFKKRLVDDVAISIAAYCDEKRAEGKEIIPSMNQHCLLLKERGVTAGFLKSEQAKYKQMLSGNVAG